MKNTSLINRVASSLPFYYGWVIAGNSIAISLSTRTIMAVAMLSVFVEPMTRELGWSRGMLSTAVSLGGLCAVVTSPILGRWLDRYGSGAIIGISSLLTGLLAIGLGFVSNPVAFYLFYVPGRMIFSGPLELGLPTALSNWFIQRRAKVLAIDSIAKGAGLAMMPFIAQLFIVGWNWRTAWIFLGIWTLVLGVIPSLILVSRKPEDMGLEVDPVKPSADNDSIKNNTSVLTASNEVNLTVHQAIRTRSFWILAIFSGLGLMAQAGISLHQVAHYINLGLPSTSAALTASTFAIAQIPASLFWGALGRRTAVRYLLAGSAFILALGSIASIVSTTIPTSILASFTVGFGVGGIHLLIRLVWADYYGREHLGSIRGLTMAAQIGGQAIGPVLSGFMFDYSGSYSWPFVIYAVSVLLAGIGVLFATPPQLPEEATST